MDEKYWYSKKEKKFLHNIDTFYYSVKLENDLTADSEDPAVGKLCDVISRYRDQIDMPFKYVNFGSFPFVKSSSFARFYTFHLSFKDQFDILVAPVVPRAGTLEDGFGFSVTSEIIVQIRARYLWELGATLAFEKSYEYVKAFCAAFDLVIQEVKENRIDYCWHTNALQNPEKFLRIDHFADMQVSGYKRVRYEYQLKAKGFESDYVALGKRGDKCFVRMYLKTKEVVQEGYKGFFFYIWYFNGLISRYDLYVLEEAYKRKNWNYCNIARLQFALEHYDKLSDQARLEIRSYIEKDKPDYAAIEKLADKYTPKLTKILNVEFETHRKMTKSYQLLPVKDNSAAGPAKRVYDYLDNRAFITEYLTRETLRLVEPGSDSNKARCDYCDFWKRLRATKQIDVVCNKHDLKLVRDYSRKLDVNVRKNRAARAVTSFGLANNSGVIGGIYEDMADLLSCLNDNDMQQLYDYKCKRYMQERWLYDPDPPDPVPEGGVFDDV